MNKLIICYRSELTVRFMEPGDSLQLKVVYYKKATGFAIIIKL